MPVGVELLHAVVAPVYDVHVSHRVDGHAPWHVELAGPRAEAAPRRQKPPFLREALDAMVEGVGHVEIPIEVECDAGRSVQLPLSFSALAPRPHELAVARDDGYAMGRLVGHVDIVLGVHGDRHRPLECGFGCAHGAQKVVVPRELPDRRGPGQPAQDVDVVVGAHRHVHRRVGDAPHSQCLDVGKARPQQSVRHRHVGHLFPRPGYSI